MKINLLFFVSISLLLLVSNAVGAELRTWTAGTYKVEAEFVSFDETENAVKLKMNNGKNVTVSLDKLSNEDKQYVQKQLSNQQDKENDNPFKTEKEDNPFQTESQGHSANNKSGVRSVDELNKLANLPFDDVLARAEKNDPDAQLELALRYSVGFAGTEWNGDKAVDWLQKGSKHADNGLVAGLICKGAYFCLPNIMESGSKLNFFPEAEKYFRQAAETGDLRGKLGLVWLFLVKSEYERNKDNNEEKAKQDKAKAINLIKEIAEQEYILAEYALALFYADKHDNEIESYNWFRKAAEHGFVPAQNKLGSFYYNNRDYPQAFKWYRKAAEQGDAEAQDSLGGYYEHGRGVSQNYAEAIKWYQKAAEQGYFNALTKLGEFYEIGKGVSQDDAEAVKWYRKALEQHESSEIEKKLGKFYEIGKGVSQNYAEAVKWYRKVAWDKEVQNKLGEFYRDGNGVDKDITQAKEWFQKAAKEKYQPAIDNLKKLESNEE
jgi:TPR repeat protein